ncbi:MAG: phosphatidate cytidylyltransferase [Phycisphaerales bacterium]
MVRRLLLGPVMIAAFVLLMWADERLEAAPLPEALRFLSLPDGSTPPGLVLLAAGLLIGARAAIELARMFKATGTPASRRVVVFSAILGIVAGGLTIGSATRSAGSAIFRAHGGTVFATAGVLVVIVALLIHTRHQTIKGACGAVGAALTAFVYAGITLGFLMALRTEFSAWVVAGVVMTAKTCDIGAYFTGRAFGRHKLIPWVSPGKTWEGLIGGMLTSGSVGAGLAAIAVSVAQSGGTAGGLENVHLTSLHGFIAGALLGLTAQLGDLSASVLKRDAGVKDSGRLLPGFGGVIDVIDSLVLAGPVAFWYLLTLKAVHAPL